MKKAKTATGTASSITAFCMAMFVIGAQVLTVMITNALFWTVWKSMIVTVPAVGVLMLELFIRIRKPEPRVGWQIAAAVVGAVPSALVFYYVCQIDYNETLLIAAAAVFFVIDWRFLAMAAGQSDKEEIAQELETKQADEARGYTLLKAEKFYQECVKNKIEDLTNDLDRQRFDVFVQSRPEYQIAGVDPAGMFRDGKRQADEKARAEAEKRRQELIDSELALEAEQKKVSELPGREKRIYLSQKEIEQAQAALDSLKEVFRAANGVTNAAYRAGSEKEKGWGVPAGIAGGIGGVVPAAVTAARIESHNQGVRARNQALMDLLVSAERRATDSVWEEIKKHERSLKWYGTYKEEAKLKLTDESRPTEALFGALDLSEPVMTWSETGSVTVSVTAKSRENHRIGENEAVMDGTLIAGLVRKNGEQAGFACLNLPINGLEGPKKYGGTERELTGICTACKAGEEYTVRLVPKALWLIEK